MSMFLNSWSIALAISSCIVFVLLAIAARTAICVLFLWDPDRDDTQQISLENEIWLSSTLVEYALGFQILTLVLFVLAADAFGHVIIGAMCATGALLANDFGIPALLIKLAGVFLYGYWIVLHQLDIRAETYPLVRIKYFYLLLLIPLVLTDIILQTFYIAKLEPDIITSCCAVVFGKASGAGQNLITGMSKDTMLLFFYGAALMLFGAGVFLFFKRRVWLATVSALGWLFFFCLSLLAITTVISSYIYAMPYHNCQFCILKPEYNYIGFVIYGALIVATFFGVLPALVNLLKRKKELLSVINRLQGNAIRLSLIFLTVFLLFSSYHLVRYMIAGGEM